MAEVLHKTLPDSELHEPKGVAGAQTGSVYKANGSGSGSWVKIDPTMLSGVSNNGTAGAALVLDGMGGFTTQAASAYIYGTAITTPQGVEANNIITPLRPIGNLTQSINSNITLVDNQFVFAVGGLFHATFTVSAYNLSPEETNNGIRTLTVVQQGVAALGAIANDHVSSTTLSLIFRVDPAARIQLDKMRTGTLGLPGVLVQYAIHRIGG